MRAANDEIAETALCRDVESHCEDQMRHVQRALHQWVGYAVLKYVGHTLGARYLTNMPMPDALGSQDG